jgi:hypothetical protein
VTTSLVVTSLVLSRDSLSQSISPFRTAVAASGLLRHFRILRLKVMTQLERIDVGVANASLIE